MTGKSHVAANLATVVLAVDAYQLCMLPGAPGICHAAAEAASAFVLDTGGMPVLAYAALSPALFLLGSILPDADHPYSPIGKVIHIPVGHRTWMHAIYLPAILMAVGLYAKWTFWLGSGYFLHLFWDSFSRSGVHWLYPRKGKHRLKAYYTGKASEYVFLTLIWVAALGLAGLCVWLRLKDPVLALSGP